MKQQNIIKKSDLDMLSLIREKSENGKNMVGVRELIDNMSQMISTRKLIKQLLKLLIEEKITITVSRRSSSEIFISYEGDTVCKHPTDNPDIFREMIEIFSLYCLISKSPDIKEFLSLTDYKFSGQALLIFMKDARVSITECEILMNVIKGFVTGASQVLLSEMKLNASELAYYTEQFMDMHNILIKQDLIKIHFDTDWLDCHICLTKRSLQLIQNVPVPILQEEKKRYAAFYVYKPSGIIPEIKLFYNPETRRIFEIVSKLICNNGCKEASNISLLLYGPSGSGKTEFAYQLAKQTAGGIMQLDFSRIQSKWVGETEKNIKKVFNNYYDLMRKSDKPLILLMNEADGLMSKRVSVSTSNDVFANNTQAVLLDMLEDFQGILVATTNMYQNIDTAFHRRFLFKCRIDLPDNDTRELLLKESTLGKYLNERNLKRVYDERWSASQLRNAERKLAQFEMLGKLDEMTVLELLREEGLLGNTNRLGFGASTD